MTPSQWQEYLYELLKALYLVIFSAATLYGSQYALEWSAEKIKQMVLMLVPWELEQDPGGDGTMVLGLDFLERCIPGNCVGEVHTYLNIAFRIMMVKSYFELDIITFQRALAISFGITSVWSLYGSIALVGPFVIQTVKIRKDLWKYCRIQEDLMDKFKETRKQGRKTRKQWRATLKEVNRQNKKAKAMGGRLVVPPEKGRRARDRYMIFRDNGSLDEGMLQAYLASEDRVYVKSRSLSQ